MARLVSPVHEQLEIFSYRPGAVRQFYHEFTQGVELPIDTCVTGLNELAGAQAIYLRGFVVWTPNALWSSIYGGHA